MHQLRTSRDVLIRLGLHLNLIKDLVFQQYSLDNVCLAQTLARKAVPPPSATVEFSTAVGPVDILQAYKFGFNAGSSTLCMTILSYYGGYVSIYTVLRNFSRDS